jgi:hypothetical protein
LFVTDNEGKLFDNINILKTESLKTDMISNGYDDFNVWINKSRSKSCGYDKYLNADSIKLINEYYKKDFEYFNYEMKTYNETEITTKLLIKDNLPIMPNIKCSREGCDFLVHPVKNNNGGTHCCAKCKEKKDIHGLFCLGIKKNEQTTDYKEPLVTQNTPALAKCQRVGCNFEIHPFKDNNGGTHCCAKCKNQANTHGLFCFQKKCN